jgi:hypothetical protein
MGRMKDLYTEMHEIPEETGGIPEELKDMLRASYAASTGLDHLPLGDITSLKPEIVELIRRGADDAFTEAVQQKFQHAKSVLLQKHKDYGPKNIALAPGGAINGLRVRMWDKMARINHLMETGVDPQNESLKDSFLDLANYAIIAMMVLDDEWPSD